MEKKIRDSYNDAILHEAMRRFGILPDEISLLDGFESFIYKYRKTNNGCVLRRILRITHSLHRDAASIRGEIDWLAFLAGHGLGVAGPVPSLSGEYVEVLGDGEEYFTATSYNFAPGSRPRREDWENGLLEKLGQMLGRMNALSKTYHPRDPLARRPHLLEDLSNFERFLPESETAIATQYRALVDSFQALPTTPDVYGLVHQDAHGGNFFVQDGQITLFDFDDCLYAWYAYDVAMAFFYILPHDCSKPADIEFARRSFNQFMAGYSRENTLDDAWLKNIPNFLKLREIDLYIAIHRSMDLTNLPPWPASFMANRREKILGDVPYVAMDFGG